MHLRCTSSVHRRMEIPISRHLIEDLEFPVLVQLDVRDIHYHMISALFLFRLELLFQSRFQENCAS